MPASSVSLDDEKGARESAEQGSACRGFAAVLGGYGNAMSPAPPPSVLNLESLAAEVSSLLDDAPVAEATAAKLSRLLQAFLEGDVLPQAERAASLGLDPTPLLAVVSEVLRLHADALKPPGTGRPLTRPADIPA